MRLGPDGASQLATWQHAAARGSVSAQRKLEGPAFPEALDYLWLWALELCGRSGVTPHGIAALTYTTLWHWAALTGRHPMPSEVQALMRIDAALRDVGTSVEPEAVAAEDLEPWPEKRSG